LNRIVFACSGSPENLAAIPRLAAAFDADVVALTLDVGQTRELEGVRQAAVAAGAVRAHVLDAREEFAHACVVAALANPSAGYPFGTTLALPLVARKLVEIGRIEGATAIAHGGDDADNAAIQAAVQALDPQMRVIAAAGDAAAAPAIHTTLWERSLTEGGAAVRREPELPAHLEIAFKSGLPIAINGVPMTLSELVESVATIAGIHGVGRVTDSASGAEREAPAAVVFHAAHAALGEEALRAPGATVRFELFKGQHRLLSAHHS
jgi:argininosuccinate synthase